MLRWLCVVMALFGMMAFTACGGQEQAPASPLSDQIEEAGDQIEEAGEELEEAAEETAEAVDAARDSVVLPEKEGPAE